MTTEPVSCCLLAAEAVLRRLGLACQDAPCTVPLEQPPTSAGPDSQQSDLWLDDVPVTERLCQRDFEPPLYTKLGATLSHTSEGQPVLTNRNDVQLLRRVSVATYPS